MTTRNLRRLFDGLNDRYFHGKLPRYQVRFGRWLFQNASGVWKGRCDVHNKVIKIHASISVSSDPPLHQVLLHEMCHIGTPGDHGKPWQKKMLRLADLGENWAREEVAGYLEARKDRRSLKTRIKDHFEELTWLQEMPSYPEARRLTANHLGMSQQSVLQALPQAELIWSRFVLERGAQDRSRINN